MYKLYLAKDVWIPNNNKQRSGYGDCNVEPSTIS